MILPINRHVLIEPVVHKQFVSTGRDKYEEIGKVISFDPALVTYPTGSSIVETHELQEGCYVYFDAWLASKFQKANTNEFYWLVKYDDIRAIEYDNALPQEQSVSE